MRSTSRRLTWSRSESSVSSRSRHACAVARLLVMNAFSASASIASAISLMRGSDSLLRHRAGRKVAACGLGDVDRQIADPLEVRVDLDGGNDDAQIDGNRLMQRQKLEGAIVDRDLHARSLRRRRWPPRRACRDRARRAPRWPTTVARRRPRLRAKLLLERGKVFEKVRRNRACRGRSHN